jgi:hypothetical protein
LAIAVALGFSAAYAATAAAQVAKSKKVLLESLEASLACPFICHWLCPPMLFSISELSFTNLETSNYNQFTNKTPQLFANDVQRILIEYKCKRQMQRYMKSS